MYCGLAVEHHRFCLLSRRTMVGVGPLARLCVSFFQRVCSGGHEDVFSGRQPGNQLWSNLLHRFLVTGASRCTRCLSSLLPFQCLHRTRGFVSPLSPAVPRFEAQTQTFAGRRSLWPGSPQGSRLEQILPRRAAADVSEQPWMSPLLARHKGPQL